MPAQLLKERPLPVFPDPVPELARLHELAVLAFTLHVPDEQCDAVMSVCALCREPWPCPRARLAYRNLEAF